MSSSATSPQNGSAPDATYYVYVGAESADLIHRVKLDASGVSIDQTTPVGEMAVENEGPHGLNISPNGEHLDQPVAESWVARSRLCVDRPGGVVVKKLTVLSASLFVCLALMMACGGSSSDAPIIDVPVSSYLGRRRRINQL